VVNEIVKRVAAAIAGAWSSEDKKAPEATVALFESSARAAIAAMREPTLRMEQAAVCARPPCAETVWKAMIDEAGAD
jgi:hypothetical protein